MDNMDEFSSINESFHMMNLNELSFMQPRDHNHDNSAEFLN